MSELDVAVSGSKGLWAYERAVADDGDAYDTTRLISLSLLH